jgi:uncharacterized protein (DUF4415 family)
MAKKRSGSFRQEKRVPSSPLFTTPLSKRQKKELQRIAQIPDSAIDYSDVPPPKSVPAQIRVGRFYRPVKEQISLRVDADVLAWFRSRGRRYQTYINQLLRREMQKGLGRR